MTAPSPEVRSFHEFEAMSREAAGRVLEAAQRALDARGRFALALSGGKTPRRLYELLSAAGLPWRRTHLFWGDERCVPRDDEASNYRLARESLLSRASVPAENIHPMPCDPSDPAAGAADYEAELRAFFGRPETTFDLVLLGLGDDGHTASLFPGEPTLDEKTRLVLSTRGLHASPPVPRLTLTLPALNGAHEAMVLACGPKKKPFFERAAEGDMSFPAARVRPPAGTCWLWSQEEP